MKYLLRYNENKMWYKSISEILNWIESKSQLKWIFLDTETTGLNGPRMEQLTQISAIVADFNFSSNLFHEVASFDEKIKLTDETKSKYTDPSSKIKWVLGFNHYGSGNYKYKEEKKIINDFFNFISNFEPCLLIAQNSKFDMSMISGRSTQRIKSEVFDTKMLIQLYYIPTLQKLAETDDYYKNIIQKIGTSERDHGLISSSMSKIGPVLKINMAGYHDALTDCRITIEMFQKIVSFLKENEHLDISIYQNERINKIKNN